MALNLSKVCRSGFDLDVLKTPPKSIFGIISSNNRIVNWNGSKTLGKKAARQRSEWSQESSLFRSFSLHFSCNLKHPDHTQIYEERVYVTTSSSQSVELIVKHRRFAESLWQYLICGYNTASHSRQMCVTPHQKKWNVWGIILTVKTNYLCRGFWHMAPELECNVTLFSDSWSGFQRAFCGDRFLLATGILWGNLHPLNLLIAER